MAADMSFPVMQLVNKYRKFGKVKKEFITEESTWYEIRSRFA
jgi:hypothetical protein